VSSFKLFNIESAAARRISLTPLAVAKAREFATQQDPVPAGLRIAAADAGCSGLSYAMTFEISPGEMDDVYSFEGLQVFIDAASAMHLRGCKVDYEETPDGAGFTFENPNERSTCGCGSSFTV
jgi:iron-sulfur cluster assembly accessory protein